MDSPTISIITAAANVPYLARLHVGVTGHKRLSADHLDFDSLLCLRCLECGEYWAAECEDTVEGPLYELYEACTDRKIGERLIQDIVASPLLPEPPKVFWSRLVKPK